MTTAREHAAELRSTFSTPPAPHTRPAAAPRTAPARQATKPSTYEYSRCERCDRVTQQEVTFDPVPPSTRGAEYAALGLPCPGDPRGVIRDVTRRCLDHNPRQLPGYT